MVRIEHFLENEIPFDDLREFGLTKNMISDLPECVKQRLLSGYATPVTLPITTINEEDKKILSHAKLSLVRQDDGSVDVMLWPYVDTSDVDEYSAYVQRNLPKGGVMIIQDNYAQYSNSIRQVISVPCDIIQKNIDVMTHKFEIVKEDYKKLIKGSVVEFDFHGHTCTIGIDLEYPIGVRITNGDLEKWMQDTDIANMQKYNFGISGCWILEENASMRYVDANEYDDEINREMGRQNLLRTGSVPKMS